MGNYDTGRGLINQTPEGLALPVGFVMLKADLFSPGIYDKILTVVNRACKICGFREPVFFMKGKGVLDGAPYRLIKCPSCGIVFTDARGALDIREDAAPVFRVERDRSDCKPVSQDAPPLLFSKLEEGYIRGRWKNEVNLLRNFISEGARILDIGCGNGMFIEEADRAGFFAEGIDACPDNYSPLLRQRIFRMDVEKEGLPARIYDAVTFYHSIEHMRDPGALLVKVRRIVKEKGLLLVQVPSLDSWQFRLFRGRWFPLFLPFHRFHFTARTLAELLRKSGWSVLKVRQFSNRWNAEGWSASILRWNPLWFIEAKKNGKSTILQECLYLFVTLLFLPLSLLEALFRRGGTITVIARKA